ncbi:hypothetical protein IAR50_004694 [Cryptococcus sp. DSM 104548]
MALSNRQYTSDPEYVKEVVRNYINVKQSHGRQSWEISQKLELIERDFSQHAMSFVQARREMGLPPSRVIRVLGTSNNTTSNPLYRAQTTSGTSTVSHRPSTSSRPTPSAPNHNRRTSAPVVRRPQERDPEAGIDAPPPPYASQDPDPEATRLLQERLAAESANNPALTAAVANPQTPQNSTPAASSPASSTPMSPPAQPTASTQSTESSHTQISQLPRPPSDPEMARIWEESQFEEAKRMSLQAQSEQEQLDEAMRLSLAEAESRAYNDSAEAGPSQLPVVTENEPYQAPVQQSGGYEAGLNSDLEGLSIGGSGGPYAQPTGPPAANNRLSSIMDHDDSPSGFSQQPLTPSRTGPAMQSKNPFLAPSEQEINQADSPQSSSYGYIPQQQPEEPAGSNHTTYTPPAYAPPPGPPPAHLVIPDAADSRQVSNENIYQSPIQDTLSTRPVPPTPDVAPPSYPSPRTAAAAPPSEHPALTSSLYGSRATDFDAAGSSLSAGVPRAEGISTGAGQVPDRRRTSYVPPSNGEDPLEMLREFDTVFLVDDSSSMAGPLWKEARAAIMEVAEIASRYDDDGIDIHFLNSKRVGRGLRGRDDVEELFEGLKPRGVTPTGMRLEAILRDYMTRLERASTLSPSLGPSSEENVKPLNVVVVTDGAPTDDPESVIVAVARRLDRGEYPLSQVGIQFLQIGDDVGATMALQQLDDELSGTHQIRDIVDTVPDSGQEMTAQFIIKTLLGGINRRLDRRG